MAIINETTEVDDKISSKDHSVGKKTFLKPFLKGNHRILFLWVYELKKELNQWWSLINQSSLMA